MKSKQNIDELLQECRQLEVPLPPSCRDKDTIISALQAHFEAQDPRRQDLGFRFIMDVMKSPALCKQLKQVPDKQRLPFVEGTCDLDKYLVEQKYDGVRIIAIYIKGKGWDFYTRSISEVNYLPISYKDNLIVEDNLPGAIDSLILDCELTANKTIGNEALLHSITGLLSNLPEEARRKQEENPGMLRFNAFDILLYNGVEVWKKPLRERRITLQTAITSLAHPFFFLSPAISGKQPRDAFKELTEEGHEGIVIKDLDAPYDMTGSRTKSGWVKWKRAIDPIDCFVSGFEASEKESRQGLIAALKFSVYDEHGEGVHIASCSNFSMAEREDMSVLDAEGNVTLKDDWYGRVASITGLAFSTVNYRFVHSVILGWRPDRDQHTCIIDRKILEENRL